MGSLNICNLTTRDPDDQEKSVGGLLQEGGGAGMGAGEVWKAIGRGKSSREEMCGGERRKRANWRWAEGGGAGTIRGEGLGRLTLLPDMLARACEG